MKKYITYFTAPLLALHCLCACTEKIGAYYPERDIDYTRWYNDDEEDDFSQQQIMLMSSNVRYGSSKTDTGDKNWSNRSAGWFEMLNTIHPTICGLQECEALQLQDILRNCPDYDYYGVGREDGKDMGKGEHMAILYLRDSVILGDHGTIWLTETPDVPSKYALADCYRTATWAKFKLKSTGREFFVLNTHLDFAAAQALEMQVIMNLIDEKSGNLPTTMNADWNTTEDNSIFDYMYKTFSSARQTAVTGDTYNTYNGFSKFAGTSKIDHFFYRNYDSCAKFVTVRQKWAGYQFISDHYPIYTVLNF